MLKEITGAHALTYRNGLYRHVLLYELEGALFAACSGGYARIYASGATSVDKLMIKLMRIEVPLTMDRLGRLRVDGVGEAILFASTLDT